MNTRLILLLLSPATAGAVALHAQPILTHGHADVGVAFEDGAWDLHVHDDETDTEFEPDRIVLEVGEAGLGVVPDDPRFRFLGDPGMPYWALPAVEHPDLPFLGLATEEIEAGVFEGNLVTLRLRSVNGPGGLVLFREDSFGNPEIALNSHDGVDDDDTLELNTGAHAHWTWAFSTAGTYRVGFEASGTLAGSGTAVQSGIAEYVFQVQPVRLREGHIDLLVASDAGSEGLQMLVRDSVAGKRYREQEAIVQAADSARMTLPAGTPFGEAGMPLWVLPQNDAPGLPFLGLSTDGVASGAYEGAIEYRLVDVAGPGDVFVWQVDQSSLKVRMNSADGVDDQDAILLLPGGHAHFNWGFTASGLYRVTLQPAGRPAGGAVDEEGEPFPIAFYLEPMPEAPGFLVWQRRFWPTSAPESVQGPDADPDGDDVANALEYGLYGHPLVPNGVARPLAGRVTAGNEVYATITFTRVKQAQDLEYEVVAGDHLPWDDLTPVTQVDSVSDQGEIEVVTLRDDAPISASPSRFLQLRLRWSGEAGGVHP